jgi:hypothetical protein
MAAVRSLGALAAVSSVAAVLVTLLDTWGPEQLESNAVATVLLAACVVGYGVADAAGWERWRDGALVAGASLGCSIASAAGPSALAADLAVAVVAGQIVIGARPGD